MSSQRSAIGATRRTGVVADLSSLGASPPTIGCYIGGDTTTITQCAFVDSYVPLLNDQVLILGLEGGGDYIIVGALGSASLAGTSWGTAYAQHVNFNIAANTSVGLAPPSGSFHTRSNLGGTGNDSIQVLQDCLLTLSITVTGASTGDNIRSTFSISPGGSNTSQGDNQFDVARQNWGGGWTVSTDFTVPMLAGDWVAVVYHTVGSPSNTWHNTFLSFIMGTMQQ